MAETACTDFDEPLLLAKVRFAEAVPAVLGVNTIPNDTLWPEGMVRGNDTPEIENCELLLDAEVTVTFPPLACKVDVSVPVVPISTLPKSSDPGATVSPPA